MSTTTIRSNGSKWYGEAPDSIDTLLHVLKENTLDPHFSEFGNFIYPHGPGCGIRFWGNFFRLSHVFCIDAVEHLNRIGPEARDYPLMVYVSDGVLRHANGAPMCAHGFRFEVVEKGERLEG